MGNTVWNDGDRIPEESAQYYVIYEALDDTFNGLYKTGDISVEIDYYDVDRGEWDTVGKDCPYWRVLCWAEIPCPNIPKDLLSKVKTCMGKEVEK